MWYDNKQAPLYYSFDFNMIYTHSDLSQPSPLEEDVWLIPAFATQVAIPSYNIETEQLRWINQEWVIESIPLKPTEEDVWSELAKALKEGVNSIDG